MLRADIVLPLFPKPVQRIMLAIGYALGAAFFLLIVTGGVPEAMYAWTAGSYEGEGALRVPTWPAHFTVIIGSCLAVVNYIVVALIDVLELKDVEKLEGDGGTPGV
jgi:TRAP-type C4-dicarboxylate transport system permease small subunit